MKKTQVQEITPRIPILDISAEQGEVGKDINDALQRVVSSGQFIMGEEVRAFEAEVASHLGVRHAVGLNSGTDALVIGLRALGVGSGDEVITSPFTFFATAEAISAVGAVPVFVDIEPETFNIDTTLIAGKITAATRAIMPVHLFGQTTAMQEISSLAQRHDLKVIEDTAQAFNAEWHEKKLGTLGDVGAFSFFPSKILGCYGDGGLLTTDDDETAEMARMLRAHGARKKYHNEIIGYNSRLDALQAAILRVKLAKIDEWCVGRRRVAQLYREQLGEMDGLVLPVESGEGRHVYHQFTVRILNGKRDAVQEMLRDAGIDTMIYYPVPVNRLPVYAQEEACCPVAEQMAQEVISLPIWPQMSEETVATVCDRLRAVMMATP